MSLIRCLSNPEGLYIWEDVSGPIMISCPQVKETKDGTWVMPVPAKSFYRACQKWDDGWFCYGLDKGVNHNGIIIREVRVYRKSGKIIRKDLSTEEIFKGPKYDYKIMFQYKKNRIFLWRVTWEYVVENALASFRLERNGLKPKRRKKKNK